MVTRDGTRPESQWSPPITRSLDEFGFCAPSAKTRRLLVLVLALCASVAAGGCGREDTPRERQSTPVADGTIVAVGDSLTAGFGVSQESAYPARLETKLATAGFRYRVVNAGVSGETSSGALSRINWILTLQPDIVILETGANDGLRGVDPALTKRNIREIIRLFEAKDVTVILAGMQMVQNLGREYTGAFGRIYPEVAKASGVRLIPFFLQGVAGDAALNQADGIHPTGDGYRVVVETVYPYVTAAIQERRKGKRAGG
jgi:acyl-CoA thioesterase-1